MSRLAIPFGVVCVLAALLIGPYLALRNYHECRTKFSIIYCWTHK